MLYYTILLHTILYCTIQYCIILCYIIPYCIILHYAVLHYTMICYAVLYYTLLYCIGPTLPGGRLTRPGLAQPSLARTGPAWRPPTLAAAQPPKLRASLESSAPVGIGVIGGVSMDSKHPHDPSLISCWRWTSNPRIANPVDDQKRRGIASPDPPCPSNASWSSLPLK